MEVPKADRLCVNDPVCENVEQAEIQFEEHLDDLNKPRSDQPQISCAKSWKAKLMDSLKSLTDSVSKSNSSDMKLFQESYNITEALRQKFPVSPLLPNQGKALHANTLVVQQKRLFSTKKAMK